MIREDNERKTKEILKEIFNSGHPIRIPKAIFAGILIYIIILVFSFLLLPFNYIFWSIYNRKNIPVWLLVLFDSIIAALAFQFYTLFQSLPTVFLLPVGIFFCLIAGFGFIIFIAAKYILFSLDLKKIIGITRNLAIGLYLFMQLLLMSMCVMVFMAVFAGHHGGNSFLLLSTEITVLLWIMVTGFLFIRYPEDVIIRKSKLYELQLWNWVKANGKGNKGNK